MGFNSGFKGLNLFHSLIPLNIIEEMQEVIGRKIKIVILTEDIFTHRRKWTYTEFDTQVCQKTRSH